VDSDIERLARARLRATRQRLGWSLDELAERAHLSGSTISRIENGKRSISLDVLVTLARALGVHVDQLLASDDDSDVVIRPTPTGWEGATVWPLSRPGSRTIAVKMHLEPVARSPELHVHAGHDWMFVIDGPVRLILGARQLEVQSGEAAEFSTMTPHAVSAIDRPAEIVMVIDRDGERAHLHAP
jgi:DNA-binding XRE family transcriptional regulator/quercetin dioxygenase-like cupin family protein